MRRLRLPLLAPSIFLACSPAPSVERDPTPLLQTDEVAYALIEDETGFRTAIAYRYRNETGGPVYLSPCDGAVRPLLEMDRGGIWFPAWEPFVTGCEGEPVLVQPGAAYGDTLLVRGAPPDSNLLPVFVFPEIEGVYRLVLPRAYASHAEATSADGELLPLEQRVSNAFVLLR